MTAVKLAYRHACSLMTPDWRGSLFHTKGNGKPRRTKCAYCGGGFNVESGRWGVFTWHGDMRYALEDAHATFTREEKADAYALEKERDEINRPSGGYVVRWLFEDMV